MDAALYQVFSIAYNKELVWKPLELKVSGSEIGVPYTMYALQNKNPYVTLTKRGLNKIIH